ncbi:MAG TPA: PrgI family protein [Candidatus Absconditabacterales bacterium]|nr:PrgI family protein [Candidatus Absconditabacterales bacterium]
MKVVFPKSIKKGILAGMTLSLGPISLSVIQLFLVALGIGLALVVFNSVSKTGSKAAGVVFAIPILIIFILIAFFKISEMNMLQYVAKIFRNKFFDTTKKYQEDYQRYDKTEILIKEFKNEEKTQKIEQKENKMDEDLIKKIEKGGLI